jgi:hypothetical protein
MMELDLLTLMEIKNRNRRGLTQQEQIQVANLYVRYINNQANICFSCGDSKARGMLETLINTYGQVNQ